MTRNNIEPKKKRYEEDKFNKYEKPQNYYASSLNIFDSFEGGGGDFGGGGSTGSW